MTHKIMFEDTRRPVPIGTTLHARNVAVAGKFPWRLEACQPDTKGDAHTVIVSRHHPRLGRIKRTFHPRVFGLVIEIEISWHKAARTKIHHVWHETWFGVVLGILALIPLAFFEQFHLADDITSLFGFGGGGH